jgi:hypothetical protein
VELDARLYHDSRNTVGEDLRGGLLDLGQQLLGLVREKTDGLWMLPRRSQRASEIKDVSSSWLDLRWLRSRAVFVREERSDCLVRTADDVPGHNWRQNPVLVAVDHPIAEFAAGVELFVVPPWPR